MRGCRKYEELSDDRGLLTLYRRPLPCVHPEGKVDHLVSRVISIDMHRLCQASRSALDIYDDADLPFLARLQTA